MPVVTVAMWGIEWKRKVNVTRSSARLGKKYTEADRRFGKPPYAAVCLLEGGEIGGNYSFTNLYLDKRFYHRYTYTYRINVWR